MKKLLIVLITVVSLGFIASMALACMWDGYRGDSRGGYSGGYASGMTGGTYQNFLNDTTTLRQKLAAKQGEYSALTAQPNPNRKRIDQLSQEIEGMHDRLHSKARTSGFSDWCPYEYGSGYGGWACW
ncbi:MAG: hypothetical protein HQ561_06625 [Desulfobacteraceae bacterium]|nr:hypothetical protein [Desulfobacteraceae bacterium]